MSKNWALRFSTFQDLAWGYIYVVWSPYDRYDLFLQTAYVLSSKIQNRKILFLSPHRPTVYLAVPYDSIHRMPWVNQIYTHNPVSLVQYFSNISILCLTTDPIHQGHEKRKEILDVSTFTAQHVRAATRSIKFERQWRHFALATAGPMVVANIMAASKA